MLAFSQDFWSSPGLFGLPVGVIFFGLLLVRLMQGDQRPQPKEHIPAKRITPECPYCAGPITKGVVKCRHCASEIKWFKLEGVSYPIKSDEDLEIAKNLKREEVKDCPRCKVATKLWQGKARCWECGWPEK
jgi:hypothetical protein